jgi:hypothetical protein
MDEPFITPHREETGGQATTQGSTEIPHEYLELRALGIILLEIFLGDVFRNEMQEIAPRSFWGRRVAAAIQILRRDDIGAWSTIGPTAGTVLKGVIHTCIQPQDLYAYAAEHGRFRKAIYRRIVNPLLRLIRERYCEPHEDANNATSNYPAILKSGGGPSIADSRAIPNSLALQTVGQTAGYVFVTSPSQPRMSLRAPVSGH